MIRKIMDELTEKFHIDPVNAIKYEEPLSLHSSFKIGGPADVFLRLNDPYAIGWLYQKAGEAGIPIRLVGNASNILFDDRGFRGILLNTSALNEISVLDTMITADAGVSLNHLSQAAKKNGLSGLEFAYGIPGTVGGAVYMNAGAYGGEISQVFSSALFLNTATGEIFENNRDEMSFGYRFSALMEHPWILLSASFVLKPGNETDIKSLMEQNYKKRLEKQPLDYPSAGSTFKRPDGHYAGQLIENSGLKGFSVGGAQVSEKHAGFVINKNHATSSDVLQLIHEVQIRVKECTGVDLHPEIIYIGENG